MNLFPKITYKSVFLTWEKYWNLINVLKEEIWFKTASLEKLTDNLNLLMKFKKQVNNT